MHTHPSSIDCRFKSFHIFPVCSRKLWSSSACRAIEKPSSQIPRRKRRLTSDLSFQGTKTKNYCFLSETTSAAVNMCLSLCIFPLLHCLHSSISFAHSHGSTPAITCTYTHRAHALASDQISLHKAQEPTLQPEVKQDVQARSTD